MINDRQVAQQQTEQPTTVLDQQRQHTTTLIALLNARAKAGSEAAGSAAGQAGAQAVPVLPRISATAMESIPCFDGRLKDFVDFVERVAVVENWTDVQRIQVAAKRLMKKKKKRRDWNWYLKFYLSSYVLNKWCHFIAEGVLDRCLWFTKSSCWQCVKKLMVFSVGALFCLKGQNVNKRRFDQTEVMNLVLSR